MMFYIKKHISQTGYTIVETMIFLAVTSALFVSAMLLINGQQRKTEFSTTVRDFDSKLQSVITNVSNGYYNGAGSIRCQLSGSTLLITTINPHQGQNGDCTFLGQYITLAPTQDKFTITSVAGIRRTAGKEITDLSSANVTQITQTRQDYVLPQGITATMTLADSTKTPINNTLAIMTNLRPYNGNNLASGSNQVDFWADPGTFTGSPNPSKGIQVCMTDGQQQGVILLNAASTTVTTGDGGSCP